MFCSNCGNKLSDSDLFCPNCGTKIIRKTPKTENIQTPPEQPVENATQQETVQAQQEPVQAPQEQSVVYEVGADGNARPVENTEASSSAQANDPYAANSMNNILTATRTHNSSDSSGSQSQSYTNGSYQSSNSYGPEKKENRFSTEGIIGFVLSIVSFYATIFCIFFFSLGDAFGSGAFSGSYSGPSMISRFAVLLCLAGSITALCYSNIGAKKARLRVFCFIGRGISIFGICYTALILLIMMMVS